MNTEKLFIEYIVIGSLSTIWILPFIMVLGNGDENGLVTSIELSDILFAIPFAYAIGMIIDYITSLMFKKTKRNISKSVFESFELREYDYYELVVKFAKSNSELLEQLTMRTNRVRVSRGMFLNSLLAMIIVPIYLFNKDDILLGIISLLFLLSGTILIWFMWKKMLKKSFEYQCYALKTVDK